MNQYDEQYFARQVLGASTDFEWDNPYIDDFDYPLDDDPVRLFDEQYGAELDDAPLDEEE